MRLEIIAQNPIDALSRMERHVNDGSPSGFTEQYTTSPATSPFEFSESFSLYLATATTSAFKNYGSIPDWPGSQLGTQDWILVHPDMIGHRALSATGIQIVQQSLYRVTPTASGRTVRFLNGADPAYVKLHYDAILGRVRRHIPYKAAIAGCETSAILVEGLRTGTLAAELSFLPETGARVLCLSSDPATPEWGMVWRDHQPLGARSESIKLLIPFFSLFSRDRVAPSDPPLLCQIIDRSGRSAADFVLHEILRPIIQSYFCTLSRFGLQPEWNAQNLLVGLDAEYRVVSFVMRDLESVDKDLTLRESLGLENKFRSAPHKCIHGLQYNYQIKHSFMFDYKLGQYVLDPVLDLIQTCYREDVEGLYSSCREIADTCLRSLPSNFFPEDGCWYSFDRVLVDQSKEWRPYMKHPNPRYRST